MIQLFNFIAASLDVFPDATRQLQMYNPSTVILIAILGVLSFVGLIALIACIVLFFTLPKFRKFVIGRHSGVPAPVPLIYALGVPVGLLSMIIAANYLLLSVIGRQPGGSDSTTGIITENNSADESLSSSAVLTVSETLVLSGTSVRPSQMQSADTRAPGVFDFLISEFMKGTVCVFLLFVALMHGGGLREFGLRIPPKILRAVAWGGGVFVCCMAMLGVLNVMNSKVMIMLNKEVPSQNQVIDMAKNIPDIGSMCILFILLVVTTPIMEELIFRGSLYPALKSRMGGPAAAIASAALFAMVHPMVNWAAIMALGLLLVYVYERTGSLWASITMHMLNNFVATIMIFSMSSV